MALADGGRWVVVADSNRFQKPGATTGLTVVDTARALAGKASVVGTVRANAFPRDMTVTPDQKTALVSNFGSSQLEVVHLP